VAKARPAKPTIQAKRNPWAWAPNAVTSANLLLGFFSILVSLRALRDGEPAGSLSFVTACWLILWATIGDVLDGKLAKLLHASSDFGMRLDTFADAVTFGLAPAVLVYAAFLRDAGGGPAVGLAPAAYFLAACFRLARYNVATTAPPKFGFVGVPTPTAALVVTSLYLSTREAPLPSSWVAALCLLLAVSMVWPLRYPAFKGLKAREAGLVLAILFTMLFSSLKWGIAPTILVAWGSFALVWGYWWIPLRPYWVPGVSKED
jgi:CDP-diacylglycerol--serine O-phosphatidyltransferase